VRNPAAGMCWQQCVGVKGTTFYARGRKQIVKGGFLLKFGQTLVALALKNCRWAKKRFGRGRGGGPKRARGNLWDALKGDRFVKVSAQKGKKEKESSRCTLQRSRIPVDLWWPRPRRRGQWEEGKTSVSLKRNERSCAHQEREKGERCVDSLEGKGAKMHVRFRLCKHINFPFKTREFNPLLRTQRRRKESWTGRRNDDLVIMRGDHAESERDFSMSEKKKGAGCPRTRGRESLRRPASGASKGEEGKSAGVKRVLDGEGVGSATGGGRSSNLSGGKGTNLGRQEDFS